MKKIGVIITVVTILFISLFYVWAKSSSKHFWHGDLMSEKKVCERWGKQALNVKKFKSAGEGSSVRAKMACSLIKNKKKFLGKDTGEIMKLFGSCDGHYFSDMIPAYLIEIASKKGQDSWQIVFLIDRRERVSDIVVHKNCCYY